MATYYIDPNATSAGDGSLTTPFKTWVGITLTANNTYLQKRGTKYVGASVRPISQTSSQNTPLTIGAYYNADGSDDITQPKPIIDHVGGTNGIGAVFIDTCNYVVVKDILGTNSNGSLGGGVTVRRSNNVQIRRCIGSYSEHGICIQQDQGSGTSTCNNILIDSCEVYQNVSGGITLRWGAVSTAVIKQITISNNIVWGNGTGKGIGAGQVSVPCGGIVSYAVYKTDTDINYRCLDLLCLNNNIFKNNGYGINIEAFGNSSLTSRIAYNTVSESGYSGDTDTHNLWVGNCFGITVENNLVKYGLGRINASAGSGIGIYIDFNGTSPTGGADNRVINNTVVDMYKGPTLATVGAASAGILVYLNSNTLVRGNVVLNCRNGISVGSGATDVTYVYHNTIANCLEKGIAVLPNGTNTTVKNNLISNTPVGLFIATANTAGASESYNAFDRCTVQVANGTAAIPTETTKAASDISVTVPFNKSFIPTTTSETYKTGTLISTFLDNLGSQFQINPSIGAYEYIPARGIR